MACLENMTRNPRTPEYGRQQPALNAPQSSTSLPNLALPHTSGDLESSRPAPVFVYRYTVYSSRVACYGSMNPWVHGCGDNTLPYAIPVHTRVYMCAYTCTRVLSVDFGVLRWQKCDGVVRLQRFGLTWLDRGRES